LKQTSIALPFANNDHSPELLLSIHF
jgi:hypothetical protein